MADYSEKNYNKLCEALKYLRNIEKKVETMEYKLRDMEKQLGRKN